MPVWRKWRESSAGFCRRRRESKVVPHPHREFYTAAAMHWEPPIPSPQIGRAGQFAGVVVLILWPLLCEAGDPWTASIGLTSDYVYRGISQTYGATALQLGVNYQSPLGWFAGAWGSNVDPYPGGDPSKELDLYAGISHAISPDFAVQATYTHYAYLDDPRPGRFVYDELSLAIGYVDLVAASVSYEPNSSSYSDLGLARRRTTLAYEVSTRWPLRAGFALNAGGGYYDLHDLFGVGYWAGDLAVSYVYRHLTLDLRRFYCDSTAARLYEDASANGTWAVTGILRF